MTIFLSRLLQLKNLGIDTCFEHIITSALVDFEKPSAKTFQYLVLAAQSDPDQILDG